MQPVFVQKHFHDRHLGTEYRKRHGARGLAPEFWSKARQSGNLTTVTDQRGLLGLESL